MKLVHTHLYKKKIIGKNIGKTWDISTITENRAQMLQFYYLVTYRTNAGLGDLSL